jgi:hypothetical protein
MCIYIHIYVCVCVINFIHVCFQMGVQCVHKWTFQYKQLNDWTQGGELRTLWICLAQFRGLEIIVLVWHQHFANEETWFQIKSPSFLNLEISSEFLFLKWKQRKAPQSVALTLWQGEAGDNLIFTVDSTAADREIKVTTDPAPPLTFSPEML